MNSFANYNHLLTTRPHDIRQVIISDLHLSNNEPAQRVLVQAFLALLDDLLVLPNLTTLYILGDWFDAWVGDDVYLSLTDEQKQSHWLTPIVSKLKQLRIAGCQIFVMHGNRDFLIGQSFCSIFGGQLIREPYHLQVGEYCYRLEHGDALCTDDKRYQRFRKLMRHPLVQWYLLRKPLYKRLELAEKLRLKSQADNAKKATYIMDVNEQAVCQAVNNINDINGNDVNDINHLIHGHTHRPAIHTIDDDNKNAQKNKRRYVLGDWRVHNVGSSRQFVEAVIGVVIETDTDDNPTSHSEFELVRFTY
ncbi:UDP-2,3-diacylglucosamine diphosphatase [Psychrobacter sp. I-STPA6b]|uniref:UDP-2,3-diacylglucosamine diphosphatase n=1 Tax=Psychrobacter sp. I-STPA6b TaxID=2585718 RepID=UPI001D0C64EC|nr:UDP-2,3-diacylglucosamine diphosphatase [Psychrobacter sp. I-STPA6b]